MISKITNYSALLIPYAIIISTCNLYGYWDSFNIEFYSYITASELATRSISPFFSVGIISALGFFTQFGNNAGNIEEEVTISCKPTKNEIIVLVIIGTISLILYFLLPSFTIIILAAILTFGLIIYIKLFIPNLFKLNKIYIFLIIVLPIFSFIDGKLKSSQIIKGEIYTYLQYKTNDRLKIIGENKDQKYIGKLGEFIFIYSSADKSVTIHEFKKLTPLLLLKHPST